MNQGDNFEEIYAWINKIPFSRPKKNIPRDFSDGVLMAEILKIYYPRFVDVRNYIPASNVAAKKDNWNTLNRKVLSKIDLKLGKEIINQLANAHQGAIERVLMDLRNKIQTRTTPIEHNSVKIECKEAKKENDDDDDTSEEDKINCHIRKIKNQTQNSDDNLSSYEPETKHSNNFVGKACGWLAGWMWPLTGVSEKNIDIASAKNSQENEIKNLDQRTANADNASISASVKKTDLSEDEAESISRLDFLRLRQEVQEKNIAISILNRKLFSLESAMKLKDRKIGDLAARISAPSENSQNTRPHVMGSSISRLQSQTKKIHLS